MDFLRASYVGGLNQRYDPARIQDSEYPLLINGRTRDDVIRAIKSPLKIGELGAGSIQGLYAAGPYLLVLAAGRAYIRNFGSGGSSNFNEVKNLQLNAAVETIFAELLPASAVNFGRVPATETASGEVALQSAATASLQGVLLQDGVTQPWLINSDGTGRLTQNYQQWTKNIREYVPIGRQMLLHPDTGILFLVSKDGTQLYRAIAGRPLDFMVNISSDGDKPAATEEQGGAATAAHSIGFDAVTCIRSLADPEGAFFVGTLRNGYRVVPRFDQQFFGQPRFFNRPLFPTGPVNQFSLADINGSSTLITQRGLRQFNATMVARNDAANTPFSAKVARLFKGVLQTSPCIGQFDDYTFFAVQTVHGAGVLVFDDTTGQFVGLDLFPEIAAIKQFARVVTASTDRLFFYTSDNLIYEYLASSKTAVVQYYAGDFCSQNPRLDTKPQIVKIVLANARESGTLRVTPFVDGMQQSTVFAEAVQQNAVALTALPLALPFGDNSNDKVVSVPFDLGRLRAGFRVGFLIQADFDVDITHVFYAGVEQPQTVSAEEQARRYATAMAGSPAVPDTAVAPTTSSDVVVLNPQTPVTVGPTPDPPPPPPPPPDDQIRNGVLAYYPFGDTTFPLQDVSGNNRHLTILGDDNTVQVAGKVLFGIGNHPTTQGRAGGSYSGSGLSLVNTDFTVRFLGYLENGSVAKPQCSLAVGKTNLSNTTGWEVALQYFLSPTFPRVTASATIFKVGTSSQVVTLPTTAIPFQEWQHVVATFDNTQKALRLYLNGVLVRSLVDPSMTVVDPLASFTAHCDRTNVALGFPSRLDELGIWNRLWTPAEIAADAAAPRVIPKPQA